MKLWVKWFIGLGIVAIILTLLADIVLPIDMRIAANVSLICMAVASTAFAIGYAIRSNWRNSRIGPIYLGYKSVMSLVLWQIVIAVWASPDWPGRQHARFIIYSLGAIATAVWWVTLREAQRCGDREAKQMIDERDPE